jgi:hypothetical protein
MKWLGIFIGFVMLVGLFGGESPEKAAERRIRQQAEEAKAPKVQPVQRVAKADACAGAKFTPCFINSDGRTCDSSGGPLATLIANGNFSVVERSVNDSGTCVLSLAVQGTVYGNSYSSIVKVWGYK